MFSDTLESKVKSSRGNKYAQVFTTRFGWSRAFPMAKKSDAHEGLSLLLAHDGAPPAIIVNGSKEQTMGEFWCKAREASVHIKQTEPHSPWSNAAEGCICELKWGMVWKMIRSRAPKKLWDDCLELELYICSNTTHDIYELQGEVPEMIVSGETSDILQFCQHGWCNWVYFQDSSIPFPEDQWGLGRYLGPSIDIGPAMTAKLLRANGQVVHRST